jgi:hypothetical protein
MLETLAVPAGEYLLQTGAGSVLGRQVRDLFHSLTLIYPHTLLL